MNEQQLQDLYKYLKDIGQHGGIDYDAWVGALNPQSVTNLHRNMSNAGLLPPDVDAARFQSDIFGGVEDYKKKRTNAVPSAASSASSGSGSPATASANARPADTNTKPTDWNTAPLLTNPVRSETTARQSQPDLTGLPTIPRFDGTEDPLEAGKAVMKVKEADFDTKEKLATEFGKGQRDMEAIAAYGQRLNLQATAAKNDLSLLYGKDWEVQLENAAKVIETGDPTQDPEGFNAAKDFLSNVLESEPYKVLQGAQLGYEKSRQAFVDYEKKNPGYAARIKDGKAAQAEVDAQSLWTDPYFMNKRIARWYGRKTAEVGASVLSLPRTLAGALPEDLNEAIRSTGGFGMSDFLGKLGDMATETVDIYLPKPTGLKQPLYEKSATVNVGGKKYEAVVDDTGAVSKVYSTLPNGNIVEATPSETEMAEIVAQAPALARDKFTGIDNTASKAFDVAADLAIARFLGGGSAARAGIASFAQIHNDYYQEAIKDMNMSASDAAQYAITAAAVNAAVEAGVGGIESRPFGAIAKTNPTLNSMSKMQARAVVGKMSPGQVAIARLKPLVTDIAGENAEELLQSISDSAVAATFNEMTGSTLETGITANEVKEQMLLTTIVTGLLGGGGSGQMAQYQKTALGAAVANPERFAGAMSTLIDEGVITPEEAQIYQAKVEGLNVKWNNLPANLDDGTKTDIIALQNARDEMQRAMDSGAVVEAQSEQYKGQIKQIDSTIQSLLKPAMEPQQAPVEEVQPAPAEPQAEVTAEQPAVEATPTPAAPEMQAEQPMIEPDFSLPITIKAPAQSTVEPVEVKQAVRRAKLAGTPLPETLDEIVERDNTPISTVQQAIEQAHTVPNFGDSLAEHYVDEVTQAVMDQTARFHDVSPAEFTSVRQKVAEELPMAPADAGFQDVIDAISRKYIDDLGGLGSEIKPLNVQMDIETVDDAIADFFASGGRIRKAGADWMMSKGAQHDQKGAMLLYFSDKSNTGIDQLAQDLADRFNMSEADANQAIADFVNSNPYGPGDYMRGRIDQQKGVQPEMQKEVATAPQAQANTLIKKESKPDSIREKLESLPSKEWEPGQTLVFTTVDGKQIEVNFRGYTTDGKAIIAGKKGTNIDQWQVDPNLLRGKTYSDALSKEDRKSLESKIDINQTKYKGKGFDEVSDQELIDIFIESPNTDNLTPKEKADLNDYRIATMPLEQWQDQEYGGNDKGINDRLKAERQSSISSILKNKLYSNAIAEAYQKAKQDGSNPELVKSVEEIISEQQVTEVTSNEINAEVDTFLSRFDKDGDFDVDAALEAIEGFDTEGPGAFLNLSKEAQIAIEDAVKSIRTTTTEPRPVEQTGRGREEEVTEPADTETPINEQQPTTDAAQESEIRVAWQEISNVADPAELDSRIDELPIDQSTAVIDAGIAIENNAPDALISALQELAANGTPLTAEQEAQVRELRKEVKPDQDVNPDSVSPTPDVQFQADRMIVRNADMFSDAMMAAGGVWSSQQQGWVFSKAKELQVRKILASRNPAMTATMDAASSAGAEGFSLRQTLRNGLAAPKIARTLDKVAKARGIGEKTRQLMSELNPTRQNPARQMRRVIRRLKQAFPNTEIVTDPGQIDAILKKHGVTEAVKGFVYEGKVHIDTRTAGLDTPIHEFGHIWTAWMKQTNPEHYQAGLELMRGTMYERMIRSIPIYDGLSDEAILEEALATAIGEQGFRMETSSAWAKFKKWLMGLFAAHDRQRGFSPEGMTASQYAEYVAGELTRGKLIDQSQRRLNEIRDGLGDAPVAVSTEDGIQFQFAGEKADLGPQAFAMLEMAKDMERRGKSPEDIWDASGWYRGVDGIWRYEINSDDVTAKVFDGEAAIELQNRLGRPLKISDIADHPTVFAAYPDIADTEVQVEPMKGKVSGWVKIERDKIVLGISDKNQVLPSMLVHEIQHIIQIKEGFAGGANQKDAATNAIIQVYMLNKHYDQLMASGQVGKAKAVAAQLKAIVRHRTEQGLDPAGIYKSAAGEVEARLAEQRREQMIPSPGYTIADAPSVTYKGIEYFFKPTWFDPERHVFTTTEQVQAAFDFDAPVPMADRKTIPPFLMYDVAPEEQILFDSSGEARAFFESRPEGLLQFHAAATAANLATRKLAAHNMVMSEIAKEGQTNALSKITQIATDNFLDRNEVAKMWEAESQRAGFGRLDYTKKEAAFKPDALSARIMKWVKKWFYSSGLLGPELKGEVERMEHNIAALTYRMELAIKDFDRAVDAEIKKWPDKDKAQARLTFRQIADNVMKGEADFTALPEGMREPVLNMRKIVDNLSREIIKIGAGNHKMWVSILQNSGVQVEFAGAIEKSAFEAAIMTSPNDRTAEQNATIEAFLDGYGTKLGTYLYRSYQVNDDKNWRDKVDKGVLARATAKIEAMIRTRIAELEQIQQMDAQEIQDDIDANKAKIDNIISALQTSMEDAQKRVDELLAEQAQYQKDKGRTNLRIQASIRAAANILKEASAKYRQAKAMADEDIVMIQTMPSDEFNQMRLQAKTVAALRKKNHELFDAMLEVLDFSPKELNDLKARLSNIDGIVNEILDRPKPPEGIVKKGMPGSKDLSQFTGRKEIPEEIRDLMGEYRDARINFGKSVAKMAQLLESQKLLLRLRQQYAGKFFFPPETPTPTHFRRIAAEGSEAMAPLNGWYTSPDIYEALQDMYAPTATEWYIKTWLKFVGYVRYGKTILSPVTHVRNIVSNMYLSAVHGHYDITNPSKGFGVRDAFRVVKDKMFLMGDDQRRDEVDKLVRLGIVDSGTSSEILKKGLEEIRAGGADWDLAEGRIYEWETGTMTQRLKAKGVKGLQAIGNFSEQAYRQEDNFFKVMGFYAEQSRYAKALFGKKYEDLTPSQAEAVDQKAADIVRDILPTYDKVPRIVSRFLRTWIFTGTFVAFPAEMFRTTKNTIMLSIEEMRDPRTRSMGFQRIARFTALQGIIMYTSYFTKEMAGVDDEEEEALRSFAKPWQTLGTFLYLKPKPGEYSFINLGYTDPHSWFKKVWWRMATGSDKNVGERAALTFLDMLQPFTEENLVLGSVRQLGDNTNEQTGQRIYRPNLLWTEFLPVLPADDGVRMGKNFQDVWRFMTWQLQPGFVKTKEDFQMAITGESIGGRTPKDMDQAIASVFGFQNERIVPDIAFGQKAYLHSVEKNDLRSVFTEKVKEVARQSKNNLIKKDQALAQINQAYDICEASTLNYCEKILKDIERAETLGVSRQAINDELKKKGFSKYERSMLLSGKPFKPLFDGYNK